MSNEIEIYVADLAAALISNYNDLDEAITAFENKYHGCYASLSNYAQRVTEESTDIPKNIQYYIDYDRMGRDFEISGDIFTIQTAHDELHIFSNY